MATATNRTRLVEKITADKPLRVDREAGIIHDVKIIGRESKNGRIYSDQSLLDGVKLYAEAEVNIDHVFDESGSARPFLDGFGVIKNPRLDESGVFGNLHYLTTHPAANLVAEKAEKFPHKFGLSHVALGSVSEGEEGVVVVDRLEAVESVDIVSRPATNAGLFESRQGDQEMAKQTKTGGKAPTVRQILEANKAHALAPGFLKLLEMDDFAAVAEMPVDAASPEDGSSAPSADEQIKAAMEQMVVAAFRDESLDTKATIKKIGEILKTQEKLLAKDKPADAGSGDAGDNQKASEAVISDLKRRLAISDALSARGITKADLSESQSKLVAKCETADDVDAVLEACSVNVGSCRTITGVGPKNLSESDESGDPEFLTKRLKEAQQRAKANR